MAQIETKRKVLDIESWETSKFRVPVRKQAVQPAPEERIIDLNDVRLPQNPTLPGLRSHGSQVLK